MSNVLVIKLSALGDFIQAVPAFQKIQELHRWHSLTLLTKPEYAHIGRRLGIFTHILTDERQPFWHPHTWSLLKRLRQGKFEFVYDLQHVDRTRMYRWFFPRSSKIFWAERSLHPHSQDRLRLLFGLRKWPESDLRFMAEPFPEELPKSYALLIPGCSAGHPEKRWPPDYYHQLALSLLEKGIVPVMIGGKEENFDHIIKGHPQIINLVGKTSVFQVIALAEKAHFAFGNDTGPMFLAASGGCPTLCVYGPHNPPHIGGHKGPNHTIFFNENLKKILPQDILKAIDDKIYAPIASPQ